MSLDTLEFHKQALRIAREYGDQFREGQALGSLGNAYLNLGDAQLANKFFKQRLEIARAIGDRSGEGRTLGNLGSTYLKLGNTEQAIRFYEQAITIWREIKDLSGVAAEAFNMALLYTQRGEPARALPLAQEAVEAFAQIGHLKHTQRAQQLVAQLQGGGAPAPAQGNSTQAAFEAFQRAGSPSEMQAAVAQYSCMKDAQFIRAIVQTITERVPTEHHPAFQQRLAWLKQIAGQ